MAAKKAKKPGRKKPAKKEPSNKEFERAWAAYNSAMAGWKKALSQWQDATEGALAAYNDACQKALDSDPELLKKVSSGWEQAWEEIAPEYARQQTRMIEGIFRKTNIESIKKFNDQWEKFLKTSGDDSIRAYQEAIKKFNQTWQSGII